MHPAHTDLHPVPPTPLLDVAGLTVRFGTRGGMVYAVESLSFQVAAGETVGLVGESGSGKSVTALSLLGLVPKPGRVLAGQALFEGRDLLRISTEALRALRGHRIALIPQDPMSALNPTLTIERQLTEPMQTHLGLGRAAARARARELLARVGIADPDARLRGYPHELSGGMRQRVLIATALSCEPTLLLADEPTTALDVTVQAQILHLIRELRAERGMAIVWITHDMGVTAGLADRLLVMYAGQLVEEGAVRDLYRSPRHPYTIGLLRSLPRLDRPATEALASIPGTPPPPGARLPGCPFAPRCAWVEPRCRREMPLLEATAPSHRVACWVKPEL